MIERSNNFIEEGKIKFFVEIEDALHFRQTLVGRETVCDDEVTRDSTTGDGEGCMVRSTKPEWIKHESSLARSQESVCDRSAESQKRRRIGIFFLNDTTSRKGGPSITKPEIWG